jgi:hypothetical protein
MYQSVLLSLIVNSVITPYLIILATVFYAGRCLLLRQMDPKRRLRLPGPRGLPYVGSLPFLGSEDKLHLKFTSLAKQFGPIYRLSLGSSEAVIISDPNLIREAFRMDQFSARPDMLFVKQIVNGNGKPPLFNILQVYFPSLASLTVKSPIKWLKFVDSVKSALFFAPSSDIPWLSVRVSDAFGCLTGSFHYVVSCGYCICDEMIIIAR